MKIKHVVFPFLEKEKNNKNYSQAIQFTDKVKGILTLFTSLENPETENQDEVYLHLLDLYGRFQTKENDWQPLPVAVKPIVERGPFGERFLTFLKETNPDIILVDFEKSGFDLESMGRILLDFAEQNPESDPPHLFGI